MTRAFAIAVGAVALVLAGPPGAALAQDAGVVFVDDDADGVRDAGEAARSGVAVTNGRDVTRSGDDGRYSLPRRGAGFVSVVCPADARCPVWFRRGGGDFPLVPQAAEGDFFFVQISDVHAYTAVEDMAGLLPSGGLPWWLPRNVVGWFLLSSMQDAYPQTSLDEIVGHLRGVVARFHDVEGRWDSTIMMDYFDLALDPTSGLVQPAIEIPRALAEVKALGPRFVVSTGDLVLEGNSGDAESVERWYDYYMKLAGESGLEIYETIGNNELAGTSNKNFPPADPRYGKALFRRHLGPTHYSFDRGPFHFVALDTHRQEIEDGKAGKWSFHDMEPDVRDWLDADLAAARGKVLVVLNHEPFHEDPVWEFDDFVAADDEGLFAEHGVAYSLAGHIHRNGFQDAPPGGGVTHITTGALSGFRWSLPTSFDARGYRLFYAREGRLYSAWKDTGQPLLGFVDPRGDPRIHPASTHAADAGALPGGEVSLVAVAADVDRAFERVALRLDGEDLAVEPWGDYFLHARLPAERLGAGGSTLVLAATAADGRFLEVRLELARAAAD